ncbi:MAG: STAS domain-containing protein [Phascolarctobacterium sp.]|nr:STAS domain-containing protein [Phascolarctobacterium sp.]MBR2039636.1 STAS domain-containing protein [Phascolarctobacterium sp.]
MIIDKQLNGSELTLALNGRLDTTTAPELEAVIKENITGVTNLVMDFAGLEYLSSAGLRVILSAQKTMNKQGEMVIRNVNETINEVFEITGFIDILTIE